MFVASLCLLKREVVLIGLMRRQRYFLFVRIFILSRTFHRFFRVISMLFSPTLGIHLKRVVFVGVDLDDSVLGVLSGALTFVIIIRCLLKGTRWHSAR